MSLSLIIYVYKMPSVTWNQCNDYKINNLLLFNADLQIIENLRTKSGTVVGLDATPPYQ